MRMDRIPPHSDSSIDDYRDNQDLFELLRQIPRELRGAHLQHIEKEELSDQAAAAYLATFIERREAVVREGGVSDPSIRDYFEAHREEIWNALENDVFSDTKNFLGNGKTARLKAYDLRDTEQGRTIPLGIKYLVTPSDTTLSAKEEHNLVREVERIQLIEQAEALRADEVEHVRVPHPYFYYRNGKFQCYGMERIDGVDLLRFSEGGCDEELRADLQKAFRGVDQEKFMREIDVFFDAMHTVCLHGAVKADNLMVSRDGTLFVIDFNDSRPLHDLDDQELRNLDTLREDEKAKAKVAFIQFLTMLEADTPTPTLDQDDR